MLFSAILTEIAQNNPQYITYNFDETLVIDCEQAASKLAAALKFNFYVTHIDNLAKLNNEAISPEQIVLVKQYLARNQQLNDELTPYDYFQIIRQTTSLADSKIQIIHPNNSPLELQENNRSHDYEHAYSINQLQTYFSDPKFKPQNFNELTNDVKNEYINQTYKDMRRVGYISVNNCKIENFQEQLTDLSENKVYWLFLHIIALFAGNNRELFNLLCIIFNQNQITYLGCSIISLSLDKIAELLKIDFLDLQSRGGNKYFEFYQISSTHYLKVTTTNEIGYAQEDGEKKSLGKLFISTTYQLTNLHNMPSSAFSLGNVAILNHKVSTNDQPLAILLNPDNYLSYEAKLEHFAKAIVVFSSNENTNKAALKSDLISLKYHLVNSHILFHLTAKPIDITAKSAFQINFKESLDKAISILNEIINDDSDTLSPQQLHDLRFLVKGIAKPLYQYFYRYQNLLESNAMLLEDVDPALDRFELARLNFKDNETILIPLKVLINYLLFRFTYFNDIESLIKLFDKLKKLNQYQLIEYFVEHLTSKLQLNDKNNDITRKLVEKLPFRNLSLSFLQASLTNAVLKKILQISGPYLKVLDISNCNLLNTKSLQLIASMCQNLEKLICVNNKFYHIVGHAKFSKTIPLYFKSLKHLVLKDAPDIKQISIHSRQLVTIDTDFDWPEENIKEYSENIQKLFAVIKVSPASKQAYLAAILLAYQSHKLSNQLIEYIYNYLLSLANPSFTNKSSFISADQDAVKLSLYATELEQGTIHYDHDLITIFMLVITTCTFLIKKYEFIHAKTQLDLQQNLNTKHITEFFPEIDLSFERYPFKVGYEHIQETLQDSFNEAIITSNKTLTLAVLLFLAKKPLSAPVAHFFSSTSFLKNFNSAACAHIYQLSSMSESQKLSVSARWNEHARKTVFIQLLPYLQYAKEDTEKKLYILDYFSKHFHPLIKTVLITTLIHIYNTDPQGFIDTILRSANDLESLIKLMEIDFSDAELQKKFQSIKVQVNNFKELIEIAQYESCLLLFNHYKDSFLAKHEVDTRNYEDLFKRYMSKTEVKLFLNCKHVMEGLTVQLAPAMACKFFSSLSAPPAESIIEVASFWENFSSTNLDSNQQQQSIKTNTDRQAQSNSQSHIATGIASSITLFRQSVSNQKMSSSVPEQTAILLENNM